MAEVYVLVAQKRSDWRLDHRRSRTPLPPRRHRRDCRQPRAEQRTAERAGILDSFPGATQGDHVLHIGCGVGYYTAIIAEVVGPTGHVIGIEIDPELASRAGENLACLDHVDVVHGDGGEYVTGPTEAVLVNAGATHPRAAWLDSLQVGGRMIMPLTTEKGRGGALKAKRELRGYAARFIFTTQIFDCVGGRDAELSKRLQDGFKRGAWRLVQSLRREPHDPSKSCWLHGDGFCLSTLPVSGT